MRTVILFTTATIITLFVFYAKNPWLWCTIGLAIGYGLRHVERYRVQTKQENTE